MWGIFQVNIHIHRFLVIYVSLIIIWPYKTSRSHGKPLHLSGGPGISHIALDQLSHVKGNSSVTLRYSPFWVDCLMWWLYLCLYWDTIMLLVEWDFNNFTHLWLIPVRVSHTVCHVSDSSLISTTSHFLMMFPKVGKQDNLRFQEIFKIQPMDFCLMKLNNTHCKWLLRTFQVPPLSSSSCTSSLYS